jgi:hypothetical protein
LHLTSAPKKSNAINGVKLVQKILIFAPVGPQGRSPLTEVHRTRMSTSADVLGGSEIDPERT